MTAPNLIGAARMPKSTTTSGAELAGEDGQWLQTRPGERCLIRVPAAQTGGAYSVVEIVSSPGDSTPLHVHQNEDEHFLVVEGTARIACGDKTFDAVAGTAVVLPRHVPHAWGNPGNTPLRLVATCFPGGVEDALRAIAEPGDIDIEAIAARFGVRPVGPLLLGTPKA
jgi:mannose-6-phosphate isomerase-like protein (cupin superfamily)